MSKKEKEPTYKLFDKEYTQAELNELSMEQKMMIQHRDDLLNKINRAEFNLILPEEIKKYNLKSN